MIIPVELFVSSIDVGIWTAGIREGNDEAAE